ncbi:transcriptional regulator NrdR [Candidatus Peregrinibacteria bacterium CG08_land_8_20_14_0_20_41_10]|nr:MAG: transcriptional regulator NrdR [Candidatus Peregrinibacteria bacterium CG1_02_41_10]PIS32131.1 MAG: transcriptional regulator NrdR [Candidatus Peregrinibacteria bacterium CG08_land_8_20_14_0_20_41_10]
MFCPKCKNADTRVLDSRMVDEGKSIRRRRECEKCSHRFTTYERPDFVSFIVVKKDGTREPYNRNKVEEGIWRSCTKRPITQEQINQLLNNLEEKWLTNKKEISSKRIGQDIMEALKKIDQIAYIRFASVYRSFKDVEEFKTELDKLLSGR